jgi:predicted AAA+ superfamily ATPase
MVKRQYWLKLIEAAWKRKNVIWLSGVRRSGKTVLTQSLGRGVEYFDCELPHVRRQMEDPESFLDGLKGKRVVLDEVHRLKNPSELLKITADHYPTIRLLATGSSTLGAAKKFRDTLAGRRVVLWLTPMMSRDLEDFGSSNIHHRLEKGGLPPFFMARSGQDREYQDWLDAYWSKDIVELFRLERKDSFQKFFELLLAQSGGIFEANSFSGPCEVSRGTINHYLAAMETTNVASIVRPFTTRRSTEIVSAPKVYGFDTGFVAYYRGWKELRNEDWGLLWEHFVLNELQARFQTKKILYWRDKAGHEVDFVLAGRDGSVMAVECKNSDSDQRLEGLQAFHRAYPKALLRVVVPNLRRPYVSKNGDAEVQWVDIEKLVQESGKLFPGLF